jgi:hypothetical protein
VVGGRTRAATKADPDGEAVAQPTRGGLRPTACDVPVVVARQPEQCPPWWGSAADGWLPAAEATGDLWREAVCDAAPVVVRRRGCRRWVWFPPVSGEPVPWVEKAVVGLLRSRGWRWLADGCRSSESTLLGLSSGEVFDLSWPLPDASLALTCGGWCP